MATMLAETEAGRAMLLNAAMTQAAIGRHLFATELYAIMFERWPHYVYYVKGRPQHFAPDTFPLIEAKGPSDCVWMIPGTA